MGFFDSITKAFGGETKTQKRRRRAAVKTQAEEELAFAEAGSQNVPPPPAVDEQGRLIPSTTSNLSIRTAAIPLESQNRRPGQGIKTEGVAREIFSSHVQLPDGTVVRALKLRLLDAPGKVEFIDEGGPISRVPVDFRAQVSIAPLPGSGAALQAGTFDETLLPGFAAAQEAQEEAEERADAAEAEVAALKASTLEERDTGLTLEAMDFSTGGPVAPARQPPADNTMLVVAALAAAVGLFLVIS